MRFSEMLAEQRQRHVVSQARPHLDRDEEILDWARAHHPAERRHGFVCATTRGLLIIWSGHDGHSLLPWADISCWGVDAGAGGGPLLGVEATERALLLHLPVRSQTGARRAATFLHRFARLAPRPRRRVRVPGGTRALQADENVKVVKAKMSPAQLTKRILVSLLGLLLIVGGVAITPIPGPWSLPIVLAGLAVLASEYDWARDVLEWVKEKSRNARDRLKARRAAN